VESTHQRVEVTQLEDVGEARRLVGTAACGLGLPHGVPELVATELATNLLSYGGGGELLFRQVPAGIEIIALDRGKGILDTQLAVMTEVHESPDPTRRYPSDAGLGVGLAGVRRMSSAFDIHSKVGEGTAVLSRILLAEPAVGADFSVGGVSVPGPGESVCGDGWECVDDERFVVLIVDGLGHGPEARKAAVAAVSALGVGSVRLNSYMHRANDAMQPTRGAVVGICAIDRGAGYLAYAGLGNISGRIISNGTSQSMITRDGVVGTELTPRNFTVLRYPWSPGATLVLCTDGVRSGWDPRADPSLLGHDPSVVAAVIYRDGARGTDDATVVVIHDGRTTLQAA
jgi:anti-sigma regulatory factor (Ser/Thr protein kinase)